MLVSRIQTKYPAAAPLGAVKTRVQCLAHVTHLAVMALIAELGAGPRPEDVMELINWNLGHLEEEEAEALIGELRESTLSDAEIATGDIDDDIDMESVVSKVSGMCSRQRMFNTASTIPYKIWKLCRIVRLSPQRIQLFYSFVKEANKATLQRRQAGNPTPGVILTLKILILDVVTRWNSLLLMLERAYEMREVIDYAILPFLSLICHSSGNQPDV